MLKITKHDVVLTEAGSREDYTYTDPQSQRYRTHRVKGKGWRVIVIVNHQHKSKQDAWVTIGFCKSKTEAQATIANDSNKRMIDPGYRTQAEYSYWEW